MWIVAYRDYDFFTVPSQREICVRHVLTFQRPDQECKNCQLREIFLLWLIGTVRAQRRLRRTLFLSFPPLRRLRRACMGTSRIIAHADALFADAGGKLRRAEILSSFPQNSWFKWHTGELMTTFLARCLIFSGICSSIRRGLLRPWQVV